MQNLAATKITRLLTDEPAKGMGAPFSLEDATLYLRYNGIDGPPLPAVELTRHQTELLHRMRQYLQILEG